MTMQSSSGSAVSTKVMAIIYVFRVEAKSETLILSSDLLDGITMPAPSVPVLALRELSVWTEM
jgi:hypothetical protein